MSFQALEWARKLPIPPTPKFLMMVIASYTDTDESCFPALTTLASDTRQSIDSVRRQIVKARNAGLLERYPRWYVSDKTVEVGEPGGQCPRGCRRTSDKIQLLLRADVAAIEAAYDPDSDHSQAVSPVADCEGPVADCEGPGSNSQGGNATPPVAAMVLPQEDSLEPKVRENAREGDEKKPSVREFLLKWPSAVVDDKSRIGRAWDALTAAQCEMALLQIEAFLAQLKRQGRKHIPAGWKYLEEVSWELLPSPTKASGLPDTATINCWSREWWAVLIGRARNGRLPGFLLSYAIDRGNQPFSVPRNEMPSDDDLTKFKSYRSDGPEMAAWRPWFEQRNVALPRWHRTVWVHLPSASPETKSTGPPDHLSKEEADAFAKS